MAAGDHKTIENISFPFKEYVLALPGWYPTWLDPLPGDFNQRHIKAASIYTPQVVLYIGKDQTGTLSETELRINQPSERIVEFCIVYPEKKFKVWDVIHSHLSFYIFLKKYGSIIMRRFGKPLLLHSYIVMRGGLAGLILSRKWKIPFILTENWTIYYPADPGHLRTRNKVFQMLVEKVFRNVKRFLPVTNDLRQKAAKLLGEVPATIIPNVVETQIFNREEILRTGSKFRFIHISTMIYQKNPEGLLRMFKAFNRQHPETFLQLVGPYPPGVYEYAQALGFNEKTIEFSGPVSYNEVAGLLKSSHALVLFSRYENLPCVILEAFCCGLPVISTRVGGIAEVIDDRNGILIDSDNEEQLLKAFEELYLNYNKYKAEEISKDAIARFSYEAVGSQINKVYDEVKRTGSKT